jgi:hypothetical protein
MVANLQQTLPNQDFLFKAEQSMSKVLNYTDSTVNINGLPAGGVITAVTVSTTTAFNAATTNNISIGQTDATGTVANAYVALQPIGPVGTVAPTMATTTNVQLSRPTVITAAYSQTGAAATAGSALVVVRFIVP